MFNKIEVIKMTLKSKIDRLAVEIEILSARRTELMNMRDYVEKIEADTHIPYVDEAAKGE